MGRLETKRKNKRNMYINIRLANMTRGKAVQLLGLPLSERTFDRATLKSAYRTQAKVHHPDAPGGSAERFKELQEALTTLEQSGAANEFDFDFDTGDGSSDWEQMKQSMKDSQDANVEFEAVHKDAPPPQINQALILVAGATVMLFIFYYGQTWRKWLFPNERDLNQQLQQKLMTEHEQAQSRKALRRVLKHDEN